MVVSTQAIILGNSPDEKNEANYEEIAFIGQAEVNTRGPIKTGDYLIASGLNDGIAIAVSPDKLHMSQHNKIIGRAWAQSDEPGVKKINAIVGLTNASMDLNKPAIAELQKQNAAKQTEIEKLRTTNDSQQAKIEKLEAKSMRLDDQEARLAVLEAQLRTPDKRVSYHSPN